MSYFVSIAFILLQQKTNLSLLKKFVKIISFFHVVIPSEDTKLLEFNKYQKYEKATFTIYVDLECFI